jgi:hypothetical protein
MQDVGVYLANPAATFEQGSLVSQDATGLLVPCAGTPVLGVAKWNKAYTLTAALVDEPISFATVGGTATLKHPNVSRLQLRSAPNFGGSLYAVPGDYTITPLNGVLTQAGVGSTIPVGTAVYASYTYTLQPQDLQFEGRNFWNFVDDVSQADGRVTVITDASVLFTTMYDVTKVYTLTGHGKNLYCGGGVTSALTGLFTNDSAEGQFVGHVIQVPSADDPFLGVRLGGDPVVVA